MSHCFATPAHLNSAQYTSLFGNGSHDSHDLNEAVPTYCTMPSLPVFKSEIAFIESPRDGRGRGASVKGRRFFELV